jgi:plasmid stabilization system protein ParE
MRRVRYHPEARAEFLHDVGYYATISTRLAERYDHAVHAAEARAAGTPEAWPKYG